MNQFYIIVGNSVSNILHVLEVAQNTPKLHNENLHYLHNHFTLWILQKLFTFSGFHIAVHYGPEYYIQNHKMWMFLHSLHKALTCIIFTKYSIQIDYFTTQLPQFRNTIMWVSENYNITSENCIHGILHSFHFSTQNRQ